MLVFVLHRIRHQNILTWLPPLSMRGHAARDAAIIQPPKLFLNIGNRLRLLPPIRAEPVRTSD